MRKRFGIEDFEDEKNEFKKELEEKRKREHKKSEKMLSFNNKIEDDPDDFRIGFDLGLYEVEQYLTDYMIQKINVALVKENPDYLIESLNFLGIEKIILLIVEFILNGELKEIISYLRPYMTSEIKESIILDVPLYKIAAYKNSEFLKEINDVELDKITFSKKDIYVIEILGRLLKEKSRDDEYNLEKFNEFAEEFDSLKF